MESEHCFENIKQWWNNTNMRLTLGSEQTLWIRTSLLGEGRLHRSRQPPKNTKNQIILDFKFVGFGAWFRFLRRRKYLSRLNTINFTEWWKTAISFEKIGVMRHSRTLSWELEEVVPTNPRPSSRNTLNVSPRVRRTSTVDTPRHWTNHRRGRLGIPDGWSSGDPSSHSHGRFQTPEWANEEKYWKRHETGPFSGIGRNVIFSKN